MRQLIFFLSCGILFLPSCLEPVRPVFRIEDRFFLVEGQILAGSDTSEIRVSSSDFNNVQLRLRGVTDAEVFALSTDGRSVPFTLSDADRGAYRSPLGFEPRPGESWFARVELPDGSVFRSETETMPAPVALDAVRLRFDQEGKFDEGRGRFIPVHEVFVDYRDPAEATNFYRWDYRYVEDINICLSCVNGTYNGTECVPNSPDQFFNLRTDYLCDTRDCFETTRGLEITVGTDRLSNGSGVSGFPIGAIPFDAFGGLLVIATQYSLSEAAYNYNKVTSDLINGNSGLNPTIPAALNGNLSNDDPNGVEVLGFVGVAHASTARVFVENGLETGVPIPVDRPRVPAGFPPRAPCAGSFRTPVRPEGWPE